MESQHEELHKYDRKEMLDKFGISFEELLYMLGLRGKIRLKNGIYNFMVGYVKKYGGKIENKTFGVNDQYTEKAKATLQNKGIIEEGRSRIILTTRGNEIIDKIEILINGKWYNKAELYLKDYIGWITLITLIIAVGTFIVNICFKK